MPLIIPTKLPAKIPLFMVVSTLGELMFCGLSGELAQKMKKDLDEQLKNARKTNGLPGIGFAVLEMALNMDEMAATARKTLGGMKG